MIKKIILGFFSACLLVCCRAQEPANRPHCLQEDFDKKVQSMISFNVSLIGADELRANQPKFVILDAREREEFEVSHLEGARYLGYDNLNLGSLSGVAKDAPIAIYCSIGYRSEKIGRRLERMGYTNVRNLYGSIFDWVNRSYPVVDSKGILVQKIHTYNRKWSRWVDDTKAEKIW